MYILLRKGKDFYYECAGRCTEKPPDDRGFYDYEHACFTLDGQVLNLNKRMRPSLIAYIQQTIKNNHETFRKEIDMATKTMFETKIGQVTNELGELLKKKDHKQAWTKAGELNALLKKEEAKDLKSELVEQLHNELRGYYYINSEIEKKPISASTLKGLNSSNSLVSRRRTYDKSQTLLTKKQGNTSQTLKGGEERRSTKAKSHYEKDRQSSCYRRNCFPPFCWSYGCYPCHHTLK